MTHVDVARRAVETVDDRGRQLLLPTDYLDAGHVTQGYAITGHKAQGLTCDHTYTLGTETIYREWGYVAMSRGRLTNQLYHGPNATDDDGLHHHDHLDEDVADLTSQLRRSRAEPPVSPELVGIAAAWQELTAAIEAIDIPRQQVRLANRDQLEQTRRLLTNDLERLNPQLERETGAFPWPKRRRLVDDLHTEREQTVTQLQDVTGQLANIDAAMAHEGLPDRRQLGNLFQRRVQLDTELRRAADIRIRAQRTARLPHRTTRTAPTRPPNKRVVGPDSHPHRAPPAPLAHHRPQRPTRRTPPTRRPANTPPPSTTSSDGRPTSSATTPLSAASARSTGDFSTAVQADEPQDLPR